MPEPILLHDLLEQAAMHAEGAKTAIIDGDASLSHAGLANSVSRAAGALEQAGIARGARVAILLPKSIAECVAILAISRAGAVFVPINPLLKTEQIAHILEDCGARALVSDKARLAGLRDRLQGLVDIVFLADAPAGEDTDEPQTRPLMAARPIAVRSPCIGEDLAAILYTSGSTGRPKGVMLSHRNLLAGVRIVRSYLGINAQDRILSLLPFSFDYGLNQYLTAIEQGATLVLGQFRLGDEIVRLLRDNCITGLAGVPTIWAILTRMAPSLARTTFPHLRYITNSGGAVPAETVRALRRLLPSTQIFLMYGLTEAFRSTYLPPDEIDRRPGSIGRAIPECEVFAVTSGGRRAKPGETGILVHRGPTVSLGYWNRPDDTARVLRPNPLTEPSRGADTICWSGDLVVQDADGFFFFVGREDAMIKSSGYRISPSEVEDALMATGQFAQVAVIGLPDAFAGQIVHAIGIASGANRDPAAILAELAEALPAYMVPRRIKFTERLPVTPNGKVDYRQLTAERTSAHAA